MNKIGVVGLGLLGRGIAACFVAHDFQVIGYSRSQASLDLAADYAEDDVDLGCAQLFLDHRDSLSAYS